jgi:hypothetical protein
MADGHACHSLVAEDIWVLSSSIERVQALEAAAVVNAQTQVVKVCPVGCRVSVRADMFGDAQAFIEGYDLLVGAIHSGADHFEYLMIKD